MQHVICGRRGLCSASVAAVAVVCVVGGSRLPGCTAARPSWQHSSGGVAAWRPLLCGPARRPGGQASSQVSRRRLDRAVPCPRASVGLSLPVPSRHCWSWPTEHAEHAEHARHQDGHHPQLLVAAQHRGGPRHGSQPQGQALADHHLGARQEGRRRQRLPPLPAAVREAPGREGHVPVRPRQAVGRVQRGRAPPRARELRHVRSHLHGGQPGRRGLPGRHGAQAGRQPRPPPRHPGALQGSRGHPGADPAGQAGPQHHDGRDDHRLGEDVRPGAQGAGRPDGQAQGLGLRECVVECVCT